MNSFNTKLAIKEILSVIKSETDSIDKYFEIVEILHYYGLLDEEY